MPRLQVIDPKTAQGRAKELFDGPLKAMPLNIFKGMANSPAALEAYLNMTAPLKHGVLSEAEREVIALVLSEANQCDYCAAAHTFMGKKAGLTEAQTVEARGGRLKEPKLSALAAFARAVNDKRGGVSDGDLAAMRAAGYSDAHIAEAVANVALNAYTNYFNRVNATEVDFPRPPAL